MYYRAFVNQGKRRESLQWERRIVSFRIVENLHALLFLSDSNILKVELGFIIEANLNSDFLMSRVFFCCCFCSLCFAAVIV